MAKYEDLVPYPVFEIESDASAEADGSAAKASELIAFQLSTNVSIRRCLNRVNSVLFDSREQQARATQPSYISWLLRTTDDLWTHHTAVYLKIPDFLFTNDPSRSESPHQDYHQLPFPPSQRADTNADMGNNPWNVVRLKGRYYAGQYIIHRSFIEFVLLNLNQFLAHPNKMTVLERCKVCLEGCAGFIGVFDREPLNGATCLFSAGIT